ncbi:hypothetical protein GGD46_002149 [Rhizobium lusitanum]|uniref:Uncharacterized protein n=1 Tax=Rhizobium lusitanum TaxID=293958 RepID=A0A7X0MBU0_9HYPH|nr:hypothetical protein [Rhizobium lusitanum]
MVKRTMNGEKAKRHATKAHRRNPLPYLRPDGLSLFLHRLEYDESALK